MTTPGTGTGIMALAYRTAREHMTAAFARQPAAGSLIVPHCPEWTVLDLMSHLAAVCARVNSRVTGAEATAPALATPGVLLSEWERLSGPVEEFLSGPDSMENAILVMDTFTHELDLAIALGAPLPQRHPALPIAMNVLIKGVTAAIDARKLPAVAVHTEHGEWVAGSGPVAAHIGGQWDEVYLAFSGRRTEEQISSLEWSTGPRPWLPAFTWGPFRVPE
jgi:uncharacterized protein (TIGR03083 family)